MSVAIRAVDEDDRGWVAPFIRDRWLDDIVAVHEGAVDAWRALKPSIPFADERGVPIRDEIELARDL